jgi:hypothetical protein
MPVFKPPYKTTVYEQLPTIFLAGSIEMGEAADWQAELSEILSPYFNVYNPRRDQWDNTWEQKVEAPQFYQQVSWEIEHLERAKNVIFYFDPATKSPITLMELGLVLARQEQGVLVCCPEGYWRKGNVDMICQKYGTEQVETFDNLREVCYKLVLQRAYEIGKNESN